MPLGGVGDVLEGLAFVPERLDELGRLVGMDPAVALAVGHQEGPGDVGHPVQRRPRPVGFGGVGRAAHHLLQVLPAHPVPLGPGGSDVAVAVLGHPAGEAVLRVEGQRGQGQVGPVGGAEDGQAARVHPVETGQVVGGGQAIVGVGHSPHPAVGPLEVLPVGGAAPEVDREPGVPLLDEVLGMPVPLVAVEGGWAAVGIDHRRHPPPGGGRRLEQEALDGQAVGGAVDHPLGGDVGGGGHRRRHSLQQGGEPPVGLHSHQAGRRPVVLVGGDQCPALDPLRARPHPTPGEHRDRPGAGVHQDQVGTARPGAHRGQRNPVGPPGGLGEVGGLGGQRPLAGAVERHQAQLVPPVPGGGVGDHRSARVHRRAVVAAPGGAAEVPRLAGGDVDHPQITAVEVVGRVALAHHQAAPGHRDRRAGGEGRRGEGVGPGIIGRAPGQAGHLVALGGDQQTAVAEPGLGSRFHQAAGEAAGGGDEPEPAVVAVGQPGAVGRPDGGGVFPEGDGAAPDGQAGGRPAGGRHGPGVGRVVAVEEDGNPPGIGRDRMMMGPLHRDRGLQAPGGRPGGIGAGEAGQAPVLVLADEEGRNVAHGWPPALAKADRVPTTSPPRRSRS